MDIHFEPGTRCWLPDPKEGWIGVEVVKTTNENNKYQIELVAEDDKQKTFNIETTDLDPSNPNLPCLRNSIETVEDLTELSHLNEPSVLSAIRIRYSQFDIYTYSGIVLIATNPFERNDELYSPHRIQRYASKRRGEEEPHLFAIAEEAYRCMKSNNQNQSIVVSGESGAGKTVSAKYIMRYFASVDSDNQNGHDMSDTERQILATNPIMEAFGNAKTTRNDNSSRFGKYLEILFDSNVVIIGARIRSYLLERSRLVFQPPTERNYHIFYQLLEGLDKETKDKLYLTSVEDFHYVNQGGVPKIPGVDDAKEFKDTVDSLSLVGIKEDKQFDIFRILAALLHIGNIDIHKTRNNAILSSDEPSLVKACELLEINPVNFAKWIVKKQIITRSEKIVSDLNHQQALVARDSVSKYIYTALFDWLVDYINSDLCPPELQSKVKSFIGVLDIYGFEHFDTNSFEQFCINYANEKLQQEFTQHVFKLEQEEYIKEEIEWSFIEFADNQPCINVIENRLGILSLLDEESRLPSGNDDSWIEKMYQTLAKGENEKVFKKPRFGNKKFIVSHYALDVEYSSEGFIEKNRDTVGDGQLETLKDSKNAMLLDVLSTVDKAAQKLAQEQAAAATARPGMRVNKKPTLGSIFKTSLVELMATINSTNAHYIRCIKPNEEKKAWEFDPVMVLSQLRACGVLETIKISCAGFPSRSTYPEFVMSYAVLLPSSEREQFLKNGSTNTEKDAIELTRKILKQSIDDPYKYQLGKTKIFFKAGILAHVEKLRSNKINKAAIMIQKHLRSHHGQKEYSKLKQSLLDLQSLLRGYLARDRFRKEVEAKSATLLQSLARGYQARKEYQNTLESIGKLQAASRGYLLRLNLLRRHHEGAATTLQTAFRGYSARKTYRQKLRAIILAQSCYRRQVAKKEFTQLKIEAKSVNKLKEVQYSLENKVITLTDSLKSKISENNTLLAEMTKLREDLKAAQDNHESAKSRELEINTKYDSAVSEHDGKVAKLNEEIAKYKAEFEAAKSKIEELTTSQNKLNEELLDNIKQLKEAKARLDESNTDKETLNSTILKLRAEILELQNQVGRGGKSVVGATRSRNVTNRNSTSPNGFQENGNGNYSARPASIIGSGTDYDLEDELRDLDPQIKALDSEIYKLLSNAKPLHREVVEGLLKGLKIPVATVATDFTKKEILFPSRIIIIIISDMWRFGLLDESEEFLGEVLSVIQQIVGSLKDEEAISHSAFWLSNVQELYSFISYAQATIIANNELSKSMDDGDFDRYLKLVAIVKEDFESLSFNIYNMFMRKIHKELEAKSIPAVVLAQALPGFTAPEPSQFAIRNIFPSSQEYKMDDILTLFNNIFWSMKGYFIETDVIRETIISSIIFVDAYCFNDLVIRRNYLTWKRGLQLNYNVTRLEEWCKSHEVPNASTYLVHLFQVSKLLQLRKNTLEDVQILYDICHALKPSQIQRLIANYVIADYETPISPGMMRKLTEKVKDTGDSSLYLPVNSKGKWDDPFNSIPLRPFTKVEAYLPGWLNVPILRRIIDLVTQHADLQEKLQKQELSQQELLEDSK